MADKYIKKSEITGRTYDLFGVVRILNPIQAYYYLEQGVALQDIELSTSRGSNKPLMVFYFNRDDTKEVYDAWCKRNEDCRD